MAGRVNAKRKIKKMKRQGEENKNVLDAVILILGTHGIPVNFPWEVPNIIEGLLQSKAAGSIDPHAAQIQANDSFDRLQSAVDGSPLPHQPPATPPAPPTHPGAQSAPRVDPWATAADTLLEDPLPPPPPVDPWAAAAEGASSDLSTTLQSTPPASSAAAVPGRMDHHQGALSDEEMRRKFEEGQARMMNRVATAGVQYKHGAGGPAAGKVLAPHANAPVTATPPTPPATEYVPPPAGDDSPRLKNGMSRAQAVAMLERATGKRPGEPQASPHAKPAGF